MSKTPTKADIELFDQLESDQTKFSADRIKNQLQLIIGMLDKIDKKVNNQPNWMPPQYE